MAETVGVAKPSAGEETVASGEEELRQLCKRCRDDGELLIIYLRGLIFGSHHVLAAVGVHAGGNNHLLGIAQGASANQAVAQGLRENQVARGRAVAEQPDNQRLAQPAGAQNSNLRICKRPRRDRLRRDRSSNRFSHDAP